MLLLLFGPALILSVLWMFSDEQIRKSIPKGALFTLFVIVFATSTPLLIAFFKWLFGYSLK